MSSDTSLAYSLDIIARTKASKRTLSSNEWEIGTWSRRSQLKLTGYSITHATVKLNLEKT